MPRAEPGLSPSGKGQILPQAVQADEARVWVGQNPAGRMFPAQVGQIPAGWP